MVTHPSFRHGFAIIGEASKFVAALLFVLVASGCSLKSHDTNPDPSVDSKSLSHPTRALPAAKENQINGTSNKLMSIWRSPKSTPQERAEALNKWLSPETSIESAISLLGPDGVLSRDYGPSTTLVSGKNGVVAHPGGYYEKLWLEYKIPGGSVSLDFNKQGGASNEWRFEHAYVPGQVTTPKTNWGQ